MTTLAPIDVDRCPYCARHLPGAAPSELWGPGEVLGNLGASSRRTLALWRARPDFPRPIAELGIGPVWDAAAVRAWHHTRGRTRST